MLPTRKDFASCHGSAVSVAIVASIAAPLGCSLGFASAWSTTKTFEVRTHCSKFSSFMSADGGGERQRPSGSRRDERRENAGSGAP